jgi:hypothetical protein
MENGTSWQTPMEIDEDGTGFTTDDDVPYAISVKPRESSTKYPLDVQLVDKENDAFSRAFMIPGAELGADTTLAKTGFDAPYFFVNYVSARDIKGNLTGEKLYDSCSEDGSVLIERVEVEISGRIYNGTNPVPCACENGKCIDDISDRPFLFTPTTVFDILMKTHDVLDKAIESNAEIFRTNPVVIPMGNL